MGTVRTYVGKGGKKSYMARVRKGGKTDTATFDKEDDAWSWITQLEASIIQGKPVNITKFKKMKLADIFQETIDGAGLNKEKNDRLKRLQQLITSITLGEFTSYALEVFIKEMLEMPLARPEHWKKKHPLYDGGMVEVNGQLVQKNYSPATVRKYYYEIKGSLEWHSKKYNYHFDDKPFKDNNPPPAWSKPRNRVVEENENELERLMGACEKSYVNQEHLKDIIKFRLYSTMRVGEILLMTWEHIVLNKDKPWESYIFVPKKHQKTRAHESTQDRFVVMMPELYELITERILPRKTKPKDIVFPYWSSGSYLSKRLKVVYKNAGVTDFRGHDLRHTGTTYLFSRTNLTDIEISKITAHTDINTLKRYHSFRPNEVGSKMWNSMGAMPKKTRKKK
jgi:integrase